GDARPPERHRPLRRGRGQHLEEDSAAQQSGEGALARGQPGALAAVSVFGSHVRVLIADPQGNYVLAPMQAGRADAIFYNDRNLTGKPSFACRAPSLPKDIHAPQAKAAPAAEGDCVKVYFECDHAMYQSFGSSLVRVVDYVLGLFNEVAILYSAENIRVEVSQMMVWTTPDPYVSATNTSEALELFGETLQNNYNGRLAHLLSTRNLGGGLISGAVIHQGKHPSEGSNLAQSSGLGLYIQVWWPSC
ncbi:MAG: M12 family metallo-peptidase, partial [Nitrososphaerota archaeon]